MGIGVVGLLCNVVILMVDAMVCKFVGTLSGVVSSGNGVVVPSGLKVILSIIMVEGCDDAAGNFVTLNFSSEGEGCMSSSIKLVVYVLSSLVAGMLLCP